MSAPISGGDVIGDVVGSVGKIVSPLTASLQQWINAAVESVGTVASSMGPFIPPPFAMLLFTLLFLHFLAFALEANAHIKKVWPIFSHSMHELRNNLQSSVLGGSNGLVRWGSFVLGASVGASSRSYSMDSYMAMYTGAFLLFVWVANQICMTITLQPNVSVPGGDAEVGVAFSADHVTGTGGGPKYALLSMDKGKPMYIVVGWLQAVTDLLFAQSIPGLIYGYGLGKLVSFAA